MLYPPRGTHSPTPPPVRQDTTTPAGPRMWVILLTGIITAMAVPPVAFLIIALTEGMGVGGALGAMVEQYQTDRLNLGVLGITGVIPFALLLIALVIVRRFAGPGPVRSIALGAGILITLLLFWAHTEFWPSYLPDRVYPGWPHGIEFVIVPLFFAPIGALAGGLAGWAVHRSGRTK